MRRWERSISVAVFGASSLAQAQSTVNLYGVLDEGIMYQSNVADGKRISLDSLSGLIGSRWGMTGDEDLGSTLHATFTLESGINLNQGQAGQGGLPFGRQAFIGIKSDNWGGLTFGRQYDMIFYFPEPLTAEALVGGAPAGHPGDLDNASNTVRLNNSVRYMIPDIYGASFGIEYSLGGVPGNFTSTSGYSVGAGYANGPLKLGAAFEYFKNPTAAPGTGFFTAYLNGISTLQGAINGGYASSRAYQSVVVGSNYTIGQAIVAASFSNVQYANLGLSHLYGTVIFNNFDVGIMYRFSPAWTVAASYDYLLSNGIPDVAGRILGNQHFNQVTISTDYFLSTRTDVYFGIGWQQASGTSSLGAPALARIANLGDSSSNRQILARAAIRQKF
ncbi:porin [Paraburkholderia sp. JHI869]|uniref:porin n=1 Tax=Paraburkholderia sp. JHI869 TaxID=3112959 RepID=UPI003172A7B4